MFRVPDDAGKPELFQVMHALPLELVDDYLLSGLNDYLVELSDRTLAEAGGTREGDWTWQKDVEADDAFDARMKDLERKIGQPWDENDLDKGPITAEDVEAARAAGPRCLVYGRCRARRMEASA